jgi:hypothetical protein
MATSDGVREYKRPTPAWPALLAAGVAVFLLAILAPILKWLMAYVFKDV